MSDTGTTDLERRIRAIPKFELHVHVEGASDPDTYWALAERNGIELPHDDLESFRSWFDFVDFDHFVEVYVASVNLLTSPEDFRFLVEAFHGHQGRQNIVYSEAFLSATYIAERFDPDAMIDAIAEGLERGRRRHGVEVRLIPDIARHEPASQRPVLDFVKRGFDRGVFLGLGLGGPEKGFPPELFTETFAEARKHGMHVVAHAGEGAGPESVRGAVEALGAERIGHGVRSVEDPELMALLRDRQVPMEVCPVSNYRLGIVDRGEPHPIRRMVDAGLLCTVSSDDPGMFSTSLPGEYLRLADQGFSWDELVRLDRNALEAAFMSEEERARYRGMLDGFLAGLQG